GRHFICNLLYLVAVTRAPCSATKRADDSPMAHIEQRPWHRRIPSRHLYTMGHSLSNWRHNLVIVEQSLLPMPTAAFTEPLTHGCLMPTATMAALKHPLRGRGPLPTGEPERLRGCYNRATQGAVPTAHPLVRAARHRKDTRSDPKPIGD